MEKKPENPTAFPTAMTRAEDYPNERVTVFDGMSPGMTLRDYFAIHAPKPEQSDIDLERQRDRNRNPHNDPYKPKLRSVMEIVSDLRFQFADSMLAAREKS